MGTRIFRRDYDLAKVLPISIAAAEKLYGNKKYYSYAAEHVQTIIDNTDNNDWALRYFAAQTLVDLYTKSKDQKYLREAYNIVLDNVNYLVSEQQVLNAKYLAKIQEEKIPKGANKEKKTSIENYNKMLKETRKREMPPIYEPLMLNCDLLFGIANELDIKKTEKTKIDRMLHPNGERLFLTGTIDDLYRFDSSNTKSGDMNVIYGGSIMILPVSYLTKETQISVTVTEPGKKQRTFNDWEIDRVERGTEGDLSSFEVSYSSKTARNYSWVPGSSVVVEIKPRKEKDILYKTEYLTEGTKNAWYDYLKVWEGHKNNWFDYAKVWENSVKFVHK